jgi:hypothetical protein
MLRFVRSLTTDSIYSPVDKFVHARNQRVTPDRPVWCNYKEDDRRWNQRFMFGSEFHDWKRQDLEEYKSAAPEAFQKADSCKFVSVALRFARSFRTHELLSLEKSEFYYAF